VTPTMNVLKKKERMELTGGGGVQKGPSASVRVCLVR
jgi:hypothetical protein